MFNKHGCVCKHKLSILPCPDKGGEATPIRRLQNWQLAFINTIVFIKHKTCVYWTQTLCLSNTTFVTVRSLWCLVRVVRKSESPCFVQVHALFKSTPGSSPRLVQVHAWFKSTSGSSPRLTKVDPLLTRPHPKGSFENLLLSKNTLLFSVHALFSDHALFKIKKLTI